MPTIQAILALLAITGRVPFRILGAVLRSAAGVASGKLHLAGSNAKTDKGAKFGVLTATVSLSPEREAEPFTGRNTCPNASAACAATCIVRTGRYRFCLNAPPRIARTMLWYWARPVFMRALDLSISRLRALAAFHRLQPALRPNTLSDCLPTEAFARRYPDIAVYDYTARIDRHLALLRAGKVPSNCHVTASRKEDNADAVSRALAGGMNLAVVFDVKDPAAFPELYLGRPVIDGDQHDARMMDRAPDGGPVIVGLTAKGTRAEIQRARDSGFSVQVPGAERRRGLERAA